MIIMVANRSCRSVRQRFYFVGLFSLPRIIGSPGHVDRRIRAMPIADSGHADQFADRDHLLDGGGQWIIGAKHVALSLIPAGA